MNTDEYNNVANYSYCILESNRQIFESCLPNVDTSDKYYMADSILNIYRKLYPKVEFRIYWNCIPAFAGTTERDSIIIICGGLIRSRYIYIESFSLIIAHELGHIYDRKPACEGMADYWATDSRVLNQIWSDNDSLIRINKSINQIGSFYRYEPLYFGRSTHPVVDCRIATYKAGLQKTGKPQCAIDFDSIHCKP